MSKCAWLRINLACPDCGHLSTGEVSFSWGGLLSKNINTGPVYSIGDKLLWFSNAEGRVQSDAALPGDVAVNLGSPSLPDVDVVESFGSPRKCPECRLRLAATVVSIRGGVIRGAEFAPIGRYEDTVIAVEIDPRTNEPLSIFYEDEPLGVMSWPS